MSYRSQSRIVTDDLLSVLIDEEERAYPWDIADETNGELEAAPSLFEGREEGELNALADAFFSCLEKRWDEARAPKARVTLFDKFAALLPVDSLNRLVEQAEIVAKQPLDTLERVVACIRPLFPLCSEEDLRLLARPYALAMRDGSEKAIVNQKDWRTLSEIERIRLGSAIATEILAELSPKS